MSARGGKKVRASKCPHEGFALERTPGKGYRARCTDCGADSAYVLVTTSNGTRGTMPHTSAGHAMDLFERDVKRLKKEEAKR